MTRHQYGISAIVSQTSFRGKTSSDVTKCLAFVASVSVRCRSKTETPVPRSFFVSKPNGNACYAGYEMFGCFLTLAKLFCHSSTVILSFFHFETYCSIFDLATLQKSLLKQNWRDQSFSTHTWKVFPSYLKVNSVNRWDVYMKFSVRKENPWSWTLSEKRKKA